jgi:hypothetical protein
LNCASNNNGMVAADARFGGLSKGFRMKGGEFEYLQPLPGYDASFISDLNDKGDVVGLSSQPGVGAISLTGTIWKDGVPSALPVPAPSQLGSLVQFRPAAVNNGGTIIGQIVEYVGGSLANPIVMSVVLREGVLETIPNPGGSGPLPIDINSQGAILVNSLGNQGGFFVLRNGTYTQIQAPPGAFNVIALNDKGEILGQMESGDWFLYANGESTIIPKLLGSQTMLARSLNNKVEACGNAYTYSSQGELQSYLFLIRLR